VRYCSLTDTALGDHQRTGAPGTSRSMLARCAAFRSARAARRVDEGSRNELSPSFQRRVLGSSKLKLRASISRAFRLPVYTELYYHDPADIGNPEPSSERAWGSEAGVDFLSRRPLDRFGHGVPAARARCHRLCPILAQLTRGSHQLRPVALHRVEAALKSTLCAIQNIEFEYTGLRGSAKQPGRRFIQVRS